MVARLLWATYATAAGGGGREHMLSQRSKFCEPCEQRISDTAKGGEAEDVVRQTAHKLLQLNISGCSADGSAPALGAGCRGFESLHSDQKGLGIGYFLSLFFVYCGAIFDVYLVESAKRI